MPVVRPFSLFVNRFEVATKGSYSVAAAVATQHVNSLFTDSTTVPIALTCYNNIKPQVRYFSGRTHCTFFANRLASRRCADWFGKRCGEDYGVVVND